jgi:hypothetical protein
MTWSLKNATVDLYGYLSFAPNITYWLDAATTYRVVFIQVIMTFESHTWAQLIYFDRIKLLGLS